MSIISNLKNQYVKLQKEHNSILEELNSVKKILKYSKTKELRKENELFLEEFAKFKEVMLAKNQELTKEITILHEKEFKQNLLISNLKKENEEYSNKIYYNI